MDGRDIVLAVAGEANDLFPQEIDRAVRWGRDQCRERLSLPAELPELLLDLLENYLRELIHNRRSHANRRIADQPYTPPATVQPALTHFSDDQVARHARFLDRHIAGTTFGKLTFGELPPLVATYANQASGSLIVAAVLAELEKIPAADGDRVEEKVSEDQLARLFRKYQKKLRGRDKMIKLIA